MKKLISKMLPFLVVFICCSSNNEEVQGIDLKEDENNNTLSEYNLLFIGNSLTYSNDLPNLVKTYAATRAK